MIAPNLLGVSEPTPYLHIFADWVCTGDLVVVDKQVREHIFKG